MNRWPSFNQPTKKNFACDWCCVKSTFCSQNYRQPCAWTYNGCVPPGSEPWSIGFFATALVAWTQLHGEAAFSRRKTSCSNMPGVTTNRWVLPAAFRPHVHRSPCPATRAVIRCTTCTRILSSWRAGDKQMPLGQSSRRNQRTLLFFQFDGLSFQLCKGNAYQ
jgi:hypothetical protein